jgi:hypothetical protein
MSAIQHVYFVKPVGMPGPIKIGYSKSPMERMSGLMCWSPWPLEVVASVPGNRALEKNIHECFAHHHSHHEWFHAHPEILVAVEKIKAGVPVAEAIDLTRRTGDIRSEAERNRHPPERRFYMSYAQRIRWARDKAGEDRRFEPLDVERIMNGWRSPWPRPSDADLARLDEVLANPEVHFITREHRFPKPKAVA